MGQMKNLDIVASDIIKSSVAEDCNVSAEVLKNMMFEFAEQVMYLNEDLRIENEDLKCCGNCKKLMRASIDNSVWCFNNLNFNERRIEEKTTCKYWQSYKDEVLDKTNPYEDERR